MTKVSYSTVFEQTADQVWAVIRDFNSYPVWVATVTESHIEEGKSGDAVGAIRNFVESDTRIRQRLLTHSDLDRFYTYESCEPLGAITYYQGTGRVTPVVDGNRAFMEWSVHFECPETERENCVKLLKEAMPQWFKSLRAVLER
jgi:ribosome-associated toxin RatA of RatAB toxin-antitoxin module